MSYSEFFYDPLFAANDGCEECGGNGWVEVVGDSYRFPHAVNCPSCNDPLYVEDIVYPEEGELCPACLGDGFVQTSFDEATTCPRCNGTGLES